MAPSVKAKVAAKQVKKEKVHHPESRKAGQLARSHLRKGKLIDAASKRGKKFHGQVDLYGFFYHAMPEDGVLTLEQLHVIVRDIWLTRHDEELEQERAARRKGRPQSTKEMKLEEHKRRELEDYRTGMEVPDLTHPPTVELFRRWDQKEIAFIQLLRFIRIFSSEPHVAIISRPGKHCTLLAPVSDNDEEMELDQAPALLPLIADSPSRFASTMMTMDGPLL